MEHEHAVLRLVEAAAQALEQELRRHPGVGEIERGVSAAVPEGGAAELVPVPAVVTRIELPGGAGDAVLAIGEAGARTLVSAITGGSTAEEAGEGALDVAALGEVAGGAAAAAANAAGATLGLEGQAGQPETQLLADRAAVEAVLGPEVEAVASAPFVIAGGPALLLVRIPAELVPRLSQAPPGAAGAGARDRPEAVQADSLRRIPVKLRAELGRFRMEVGRAVALAPGSVVEIDTEVDDPIEVFVNGRRLGTARLLVGAEGEWAIRLEELVQPELQRVSAELDSSQ